MTLKIVEKLYCHLKWIWYLDCLMTLLSQAPHHTVLFNIAGLTMIKMTIEDLDEVYSFIECTMNGDGLYEDASKETILQAYYDQEMSSVYGLNWVNHISSIMEETGMINKYIKR